MAVFKTSDVNQQAVRRAMQYWIDHWDWECTTLFGIELNDMKSALHSWPSAIGEDDPKLEAAATGALRELLYGASALPKSAVQEALGISYDSVENLLKELYGE